MPRCASDRWPNGRVTHHVLQGFNLPCRRENCPLLDIAHRGSLLLDAAGMPRDAVFVANTLLRDRCGGHDLDSRNAALKDSYGACVFGIPVDPDH